MRPALLASRLARPAAVLLALAATGAAQDPESREAPPESRPSLVKEPGSPPIDGAPMATIVTGRLVDSESRPMRRTRFVAWLPEPPALVCSPGAARAVAQRTDETGRFQLRFDVDPGALTVKKLVVSARPRAEGDSRATLGPEPAVTASLRAGQAPGSFDAGDVAFPAARFVAAGRVVSEHGVQVSSAEIVVMEEDRGGWHRALGFYDARTLSGLHGRFEVRSHETPRESHGLIANADFWACVNPTPFEVGGRDVEVRVVRAGGIEGSLAGFGKHYWSRFGDGSPVSVVVEGEGAAIAARNESIEYRPADKHLRLDVADSRFATKRLLPGTYSVRFIGRDSPEPLLSVDGVVVNPGEITADARLQGVDVTRFLTKHMVTVVDEAGKPLSALVAARTPGGFTQFPAGASGRATVFTPQAAVDLVVVARGFRARSLPGVAADVTVTLERAAPRILTLKLDDSIQLPPPPLFIAAQLRWVGEPGQAPAAEAVWSDPRNDFGDHWRNPRFDCHRTATIRVQNPGVYEVQLWFEEDRLDGSGGTGLDQREGRRLVTVPANEDVTVVLFPDPVDLARSLEADKK